MSMVVPSTGAGVHHVVEIYPELTVSTHTNLPLIAISRISALLILGIIRDESWTSITNQIGLPILSGWSGLSNSFRRV